MLGASLEAETSDPLSLSCALLQGNQRRSYSSHVLIAVVGKDLADPAQPDGDASFFFSMGARVKRTGSPIAIGSPPNPKTLMSLHSPCTIMV